VSERFAGRGGSRAATYALVCIALIVTVSILAPLLTPYGRDAIDLDNVLAHPSPAHVLGTDELGRDLFTRLIFGGRFTLLVAFCSVTIATLIGLTLGALSGYRGGRVDSVVTAAIDLFLSVPTFLLLLAAAAFGGGKLWIIPVVIGATSWMECARIVRAKVFSLKEEEFVEAARSIGVRDRSIVFRHILPHALAPVIVSATVGFAQAMLIESGLSFLGFGVQPPLPTWGNMLENAWIFLRRSPTAAVAPGFMIFITCLCFNIVGDNLRRMLARDR
jgi:peptide/nickel transport system permease protein